MFRTIVGIATSPLIAVALLCVGMVTAVAHLFALPVLYLWERYLERKPVTGSKSSPATSARPPCHANAPDDR